MSSNPVPPKNKQTKTVDVELGVYLLIMCEALGSISSTNKTITTPAQIQHMEGKALCGYVFFRLKNPYYSRSLQDGDEKKIKFMERKFFSSFPRSKG
jgi:hypothetical protein